jgi:hypothetical protein
MKARCEALIAAEQPALLDSPWHQRLFVRKHERSRWQRFHLGIGRRIRQWLEGSL